MRINKLSILAAAAGLFLSGAATAQADTLADDALVFVSDEEAKGMKVQDGPCYPLPTGGFLCPGG